MKLNKLTSTIAALALAATTFMGAGVTAQASGYSDGEYTADVMMWQFFSPTKSSMCAPLFAEKADITISGEYTELKLYVASPIPGFADASAEAVATGGIMKDTVIYGADWYLGEGNFIQGTQYVASYDNNSLTKYFDKTSTALFGITAGNDYTTDTITVVIPTELIQEGTGAASKGDDGVTAGSFVGSADTDKMIAVQSYVNVVMASAQEFFLELTNIQAVASNDNVEGEGGNEELPSQTETRSATVTATVAKNESTYTVTVPSSIELSELSTSEDTSVSFDVKVEFSKIGNDEVEIEVATAAVGVLSESVSGYELAFTNSFGTQTFADTATKAGAVTVKGADVFDAEAGDYTGTVSFVITTNK